MDQGICSTVLQLHSDILRVARVTDWVVDVGRRRNDVDTTFGTKSEAMRFRVSDLLGGYQYELADHESFIRLNFPLANGSLSVDVDKDADIIELADNIAALVNNPVPTLLVSG
jgi:hypothetical protein